VARVLLLRAWLALGDVERGRDNGVGGVRGSLTASAGTSRRRARSRRRPSSALVSCGWSTAVGGGIVVVVIIIDVFLGHDLCMGAD